ncbi:Ubiquitin recognition factor in ER-associated degradation protein 1 [Halotydeus destructor]|nr:Ubiquitin recognition factor in ER-associated degradation protein 1 [Halotydeus destructor]
MFGFANMFHEPAMRPFNTMYKCYSVSMLPGNERLDVEKGGKIIMPPSALDQLTRLNIVYPMLFKLTNINTGRMTHSGVLEFVADEGKVYLPYWMMRNLLLDEGSMIRIESTSLPVAEYSKFQPQSVDFLDITNPKAVLENALRNFACLTKGDVIAIDYNSKLYELCVLETKPGEAVSIIECDMNVEFEAPVGYKEPTRVTAASSESGSFEDVDSQMVSDDDEGDASRVPFAGIGNRLDGKTKNLEFDRKKIPRSLAKRGIPDYSYQIGTLRFIRTQKPVAKVEESEAAFQAFGGDGQILKRRN